MANEIQVSYVTGRTIYALIRPTTSGTMIWNGTAFEAYATGNYANYPVNLTEQGSASAYYTVSFPTGITRPDMYNVVVRNRAGGSPSEANDTTIAVGDVQWNGTGSIPLSDIATSGLVGASLPIPIYRGQMVQNFQFLLVNSSDHVTAFTSGVVSGQIVRDGGSFTNLQSGAFTEVGNGFYRTTLTSGDLNCQTASLLFTSVGISGGSADPRRFSMVLQRSSGV